MNKKFFEKKYDENNIRISTVQKNDTGEIISIGIGIIIDKIKEASMLQH